MPSIRGALRFIRYAFMPNRLGYCGTDDHGALLDYGVEGVVDGGLPPLLTTFAGATPYLRLIARANDIEDPFDERVVEAYWLGNHLLDGVEATQLYEALRGEIGARLEPKAAKWVLPKAPAGARPHHNFHVFDVYRQVAGSNSSLSMMDQCRISWGKVVEVDGSHLLVERRPLEIREGRLALSDAEHVRATRQVDGKGFADRAEPGDWVSLHWNWVCEVIPTGSLRNLEAMTMHHMRLASETL